MHNPSRLRARLAVPSLPVYFMSLAVIFGVVSVVLRQTIVHDSNFTIVNGLLIGTLFAAIMATSVAVARWRLHRSIGMSLTPQQQLSLNWSVEHVVLPIDPKLRQVFPKYVRYFTTLNRHSRFYIPVVMGGLTIGSIALYAHTHETLWLLYGSLFVILAIIGMHGVNRALQRLQRIAPRLEPVQHRQLQPNEAAYHTSRPTQHSAQLV